MTNDEIEQQIHSLTSALIEAGVSIDQNYPSNRKQGDYSEISFKGSESISMALRDKPYKELYEYLDSARCFNMKLIDGALIHILYRLERNTIVSQRLCFFPSPHLEDYKNAQEIYDGDYIYGNVTRENIIPFPIRFDFSSDNACFRELYHSKSHLTLGELNHCRIPVSSPLAPLDFISFLMRHFYFEDKNDIINQKIYNAPRVKLKETISPMEKTISYFNI